MQLNDSRVVVSVNATSAVRRQRPLPELPVVCPAATDAPLCARFTASRLPRTATSTWTPTNNCATDSTLSSDFDLPGTVRLTMMTSSWFLVIPSWSCRSHPGIHCHWTIGHQEPKCIRRIKYDSTITVYGLQHCSNSNSCICSAPPTIISSMTHSIVSGRCMLSWTEMS